MVIGGLQRLTLSDFPGRLAAVLFTRGCNFRCPFCHNPELVDTRRFAETIPQAEVFSFLRTRSGTLDGVVVTGGEPTIHADLPALLRSLKELGLAVKLDTNGSAPGALERLIAQELVDYVALDIKSSPALYPAAAGVPVDIDALRCSVELLAAAGLAHELRMTYVERLIPLKELEAVAELARGCQVFFVQAFQPSKALDPSFLLLSRPSRQELEQVRSTLEKLGLPATVRQT